MKPDAIRDFARMLVNGRTQLLFGWCIQRQEHGEQPYWMGAVLAAMIGQIGLPGGGISYGHHYSGIGVPSTGFAGPGGFPRNLDQGAKPKWDNNDFNGYSRTIPVARWIDAILEPGKKINHNGNTVTLPGFKMMVISGCNPWHHHQDRNKMKRAFQKLETVVTIDFSWTATCRFSDIVLPACTQWERNDIDSYGSYSGKGLIAMHRLVDPLFQSRTDFEIMTELTRRLAVKKSTPVAWMRWSGYVHCMTSVRKPTKVNLPCQNSKSSGKKASLILVQAHLGSSCGFPQRS